MDARTIAPDCLPEVLDAIALASACALLESVTGLDMEHWRYRFKSEAVEVFRGLTKSELEALIGEKLK